MIRRWAFLMTLCLLGVAGCLHEAAETCGNGALCPPGTQCADTGNAQICILGTCGNGKPDPGEACDDGNNRSGDGCPADCSEPCGDGVRDPDEACDDGNRDDGDGCSADCKTIDSLFLVTPSSASFAATEGDPLPPAATISVRGEFTGDSVLAGFPPGVDQPTWLSIGSGRSAEGTTEFQLQITDTSVVGTRSTTVRFLLSHAKSSGLEAFDLPVSYTIARSPLTVQASPPQLSFIATSGAPPPPAQTASVTFNGERATLQSAPPWITVTAPSAPTQSPASFAIAINNTSFAAGTTLSGDVVLATTDSRGTLQRTTAVHVSYVVSAIAVQFVAPYLGVAGVGGTVHIRGQAFPTTAPLTIGFGDTVVGPVFADSTTQITVSYPPLPAGRYPVKLDPPSSPSSSAELVIVAPPPFVYQAISAPSERSHIIFDGERQEIYGVNRFDQELERFAYADGTWSALAPHVLPQLTDAAMAPDGRSLVVIDTDHVNEMSLIDGLFLPIPRASNPDPLCGGFFDQAEAANNGEFLLVFDLRECSGFTNSYLYDITHHSLAVGFELFNGLVAASADGSRIYAGSNGLSPAPEVDIFDALTSTASVSQVDVNLNDITVSGNASRVILQNTEVYSRALSLTGNLAPGGTTLASRDSRRAFVYVEDSVGAHLDIYDLDGALQAGARYPLIKTVMIPDQANGGNPFSRVAMTSSLDDAVVFISGSSKLLVVPVN